MKNRVLLENTVLYVVTLRFWITMTEENRRVNNIIRRYPENFCRIFSVR